MVGARHHRAPVGLLDAGGDHLRIRRHYDLAHARGLRAAHDVDDHRLAGDVEERLAGKPRRGHARRDEDESVGHRSDSAGCHAVERGWSFVPLIPSYENPVAATSGPGPRLRGDERTTAGYTGCQGRGKPAICAPPQSAAACRFPITLRARASRRWTPLK